MKKILLIPTMIFLLLVSVVSVGGATSVSLVAEHNMSGRIKGGIAGVGVAVLNNSQIIGCGNDLEGTGQLYKTYYTFDTAGLPNNAIIINASIETYIDSNTLVANDVVVYHCDYGTTLTIADYTAANESGEGAYYSGGEGINSYHTFYLNNLTYINNTGNTQYCLYNNKPIVDEGNAVFGDTAEVRLNITYGLPQRNVTIINPTNNTHYNTPTLIFTTNTTFNNGQMCYLRRNDSGTTTGIGGSRTIGYNRQNDYVGYWDFNGNPADHSIGQTHGTIAGGVINDSGVIGGAYEFDGISGTIAISSTNFNPIIGTICLWNKAKLPDADLEYLFSVRTGNNDRLIFMDTLIRIGSPGGEPTIIPVAPVKDVWEHRCMVWNNESTVNGKTLEFYLDGELTNSVTTAFTSWTVPANMYIGSRLGAAYYANSSIDEPKLWNKSLTPTQIRNDYERRAFFYGNTNTSTNIENVFGQTMNATLHGTPNLEDGVVPGVHALRFDGDDNITIQGVNNTMPEGTIRFWFKSYDSSQDYLYSQININGEDRLYVMKNQVAGKVNFRFEGENGGLKTLDASYNDFQDYFYAATWNGSHCKLYLNGTEVDSDSCTTSLLGGYYSPAMIGDIPDWLLSGAGANATIYHFAIDGIALNDSEILEHYNGSKSIFNRSGLWNLTDTYAAGTEQQFEYYVECNESRYGATSTEYSENYSIYVDLVNPLMSYVSEDIVADNSTLLYYNNNPKFNLDFSDYYLYRTRINVTNSSNHTIYFNDSNALSGTNIHYIVNATLNLTGQKPQTFKIFYEATDTHTKKTIPFYSTVLTPSINRINYLTEHKNNLYIELLNKEETELITKKEKDRHTFGYEFKKAEDRLLEIEVGCSGELRYLKDSPFKAHFVCMKNEMEGNWIDFEGQGKIKNIKKKGNNYVVSVQTRGKKVLFNSVGGLNLVNRTITFLTLAITENIYYVPSLVYSAATRHQQFILGLYGYNGTGTPSANLTYNGTLYTNFTRTNTTPNNYNLSFQIDIDSIGTTVRQHNRTFYFNYTVPPYHNDTDQLNQTVNNLFVDNCSNYGTVFLNLTNFLEDLPHVWDNVTLDVGMTYWLNNETEIKYYNETIPSHYSHLLCMWPMTTNFSSNIYLKYTQINGFTHRYYFVKEVFSNLAKNFSIYNYNDTTGISDFILTVRRASNYQFYSNVVGMLQRWYVGEGVWRTVQMDKSGSFGTLFYNIHEENTDYRVIFLDENGNVLDTTESMKLVCDTAICSLTYRLSPYTGDKLVDDLIFTWDYNNVSKVVNVTWNDPTGQAATVRTVVTQEKGGGTITICDFSSFAPSGRHSCNISLYTGKIFVRSRSSQSPLIDQIAEWIEVIPTRFIGQLIGEKEGAFWTFGFTLTMAAFSAFSPMGGIIGVLIGLTISYLFGFMEALSIVFISLVAILAIAIGIKVRK